MQKRVQFLLKEAITNVCQGSFPFHASLYIQANISVIIDDCDSYNLQVTNHVVTNTEPVTSQLPEVLVKQEMVEMEVVTDNDTSHAQERTDGCHGEEEEKGSAQERTDGCHGEEDEKGSGQERTDGCHGEEDEKGSGQKQIVFEEEPCNMWTDGIESDEDGIIPVQYYEDVPIDAEPTEEQEEEAELLGSNPESPEQVAAEPIVFTFLQGAEELLEDESSPQLSISPEEEEEEDPVFSSEDINVQLLKVGDLYHCPHCPLKTTHGSAIRGHLAAHRRGRLKCPHCGQLFLGHFRLKEHVNRHHTVKTVCRICAVGFQTRSQLLLHKKEKHAGTKSAPRCPECPYCAYKSSYPGNMERHIRTHQVDDSVQCAECHVKCSDAHQLKLHMDQEHQKQSPNVCFTCGKSFRSQKALKLHQRSAQCKSVTPDTKPLLCSVCGYSTMYPKTLEKHQNAGVICESCKKVCFCKGELRTHMQREHPFNSINRPCDICGKLFHSRQGLYNHKKIAHQTVQAPSHTCQVCGKVFPVYVYLTRHLKSHDSKEPYKCPKCSRTFKYHRNWKAHKQGCINESGYACEVCGKAMKTEYTLQTHLRTVHNADRQKFPCSKCGVLFLRSASRVKHEQECRTRTQSASVGTAVLMLS